MPQDRNELQAKLAACRPEQVVLGSNFIALAGEVERLAAGKPGLPAYLARLDAPRRVDSFRYPLAEYLVALYDGADLLEGQLGEPQAAMRDLGNAVAARFTYSPAGEVARKLAAGKSPIDLMAIAPGVFASRSNFGKRTYQRLSPTQCALHVRECPLPMAYYAGTLDDVVTLNGHRAKVEGQVLGPLACDLTITWDGLPPAERK